MSERSKNPFLKVFDPVVECYSRGALTGLASFWFGKYKHSINLIIIDCYSKKNLLF